MANLKEVELRLKINTLLETLRVEMQDRILKQITHPNSKITGYDCVSVKFSDYNEIYKLDYDAPKLTFLIQMHETIQVRGKLIAFLNTGLNKTHWDVVTGFVFDKTDLSFDEHYCRVEKGIATVIIRCNKRILPVKHAKKKRTIFI